MSDTIAPRIAYEVIDHLQSMADGLGRIAIGVVDVDAISPMVRHSRITNPKTLAISAPFDEVFHEAQFIITRHRYSGVKHFGKRNTV